MEEVYEISNSIAETAKANKLKPYNYFEYLVTEIPKLIKRPHPLWCVYQKLQSLFEI